MNSTRIEQIQKEMRALEEELAFLRGINGADENLLTVVATTNGLKAAAEKLNVSQKHLQRRLEEAKIPHLYGEKWSTAVKRHLNREPIIDTYTYPASWYEKIEKIAAHAKRFGIAKSAEVLLKSGIEKGEIPAETRTVVTVLGRFLQIHGYDIKGEFVGVPPWIES